MEEKEYLEERFYSMIRMNVLLLLTFASFFISPSVFSYIQLLQLVLGILLLFSLAYHAFITYRPSSFVVLRKNVLMFMDFAVLTFFINILGEEGVYLMPLYTIIVMQGSVSYGLNYYISGALIATGGLAYLAIASPYWREQYDVIVAFGITTLLVPLFYIKTLLRMDRKIGEAEEKIAYVDKLEEQISVELDGVADRESYKKKMKELIKEKEMFSLLFISLVQVSDGKEEGVSDVLLQDIADGIQNVLDRDDHFARLSESEFVIISQRPRAFLRKYLQKLEKAITSTHRLNGRSVRIEPNIGVALYPEDGQTEMSVAKCADEAMSAVREKQNVHYLFYRGIAS